MLRKLNISENRKLLVTIKVALFSLLVIFALSSVTWGGVNRHLDQAQHTINFGGERFSFTGGTTLREILAELELEHTEHYIFSHDLDARLRGRNTRFVVDRVEYVYRTYDRLLEHAVVTVPVQNVPIHTYTVEQEGEHGMSAVTMQRRYINGVLVENLVVDELIVHHPIEEIRHLGVGGVRVGADGVERAFSHYIDVVATAYTSVEATGLTRTGRVPVIGMMAVDPRVIPLRTRAYVTGAIGSYGVLVAEDTGSAIRGNKIDIFYGDGMDAWRAAMRFGRRNMRVYILLED